MFTSWEIDAGDTCHDSCSSTLPLLVARILTQDAHHTLAAHDLALGTYLLDARSDLHLAFSLRYPNRSLILPRFGSNGAISIRTLSPGITRTMVCLATPPREAKIFVPSFSPTRYKACGR